jgi:membrane protease YdiL (CAAX protease family)
VPAEAMPPLPAWPGAPPLFRRPHPNFWWAILWCVGYLLFTQVPGGVVAAVLLVAMLLLTPHLVATAPDAGASGLLLTPGGSLSVAVAIAVAHGLGILLSLAALRLVVGRDWPRQVALRRPGGFHLLLALVGLPAVFLLANGLAEVLRRVLPLPRLAELGLSDIEVLMKVFVAWPWPVAVLLVGGLPGLGEELFCRAFLGRGLVARHGVVWGVLFTSFFFGAIHIHPIQGTVAAVIALWLHFTYLTTRSLWVPVLLHFLNNSVAVVVSRFPQVEALEQRPAAVPGYVFVAAAVLLLAVVGALYQSRARLVAEGGGPPPWQPAYPGVEYPPQGSGTRVHRPLPTAGVAALVLAGLAGLVAACVVAALRA